MTLSEATKINNDYRHGAITRVRVTRRATQPPTRVVRHCLCLIACDKKIKFWILNCHTGHFYIMNKRANNIMDDSSSLPLLLSKHHQLNEHEVDYLLLLLTIIESKNWIALRCSIYSSPATFQQFARKVARVPHLNLNGTSM